MTTLNVMKGSEKKVGKIHVPTKEYHNDGNTIQLLLSNDFSTLTVSIKGKDSIIKLSKDNAKTLSSILGEGMI